MRTPLLLSLIALTASCTDRSVQEVDPQRTADKREVFQTDPIHKLDILFVIDNSGSMSDKQGHLAQSFPTFIQKLEALPDGLPDVHLGVVTSDLGALPYTDDKCNATGGDHGVLQNTLHGACNATLSGRYITDAGDGDGTGKNYTGALADVFSCIARVGAAGCGLERHFDGMQRALDGSNPENNGFLRADAYLAVIFLADEDDCSPRDGSPLFDPAANLGPLNFRCTSRGIRCNPDLPWSTLGPRTSCTSWEDSPDVRSVQSYVDFLIGLKGGHRDRVIVAAITGDVTPVEVGTDDQNQTALVPSCNASQLQNGKAVPGIRQAQLAHAFGDNGAVVSICANDFSPALARIGDLIGGVFRPACLRGVLTDVAGGVAIRGGQKRISCTVTDVEGAGIEPGSQTVVPACAQNGGAMPCWQPDADPVSCPAGVSPDTTKVTIARAVPAVAGVETVVHCQTDE